MNQDFAAISFCIYNRSQALNNNNGVDGTGQEHYITLRGKLCGLCDITWQKSQGQHFLDVFG